MSSIVVAILAMTAFPVVIAMGVQLIRGSRATARSALTLREAGREDDALILALWAGGNVTRMRIERITVARDFASRVLAQPPDGFVRLWERSRGSALIWEGRLAVKRGGGRRLVIPMRTDVAATGCITFVYSYRAGLVRTRSSASMVYRPPLVAVGA